VQSPETRQGIRLLISIWPALFGAVAVALMIFYPLSDRQMQQVESDLAQRRR
jgi:GPH family glycoside/pentoside/hexuronide:cation symporter